MVNGKHGAFFLVGITGGMGCGKSALLGFVAARGYLCVDADREGHAVLDSDEDVRGLVGSWGQDLLRSDGSVDRQRLAGVVFSDRPKLKALEALTHPRILQRILEKARNGARFKGDLVFVEAALLFESGWAERLDCTVLVDSPRELQVRRVTEARGMRPEEAERRLAAQADAAGKRPLADLVVENDGSIEALQRKTEALLAELERRFGIGPVDDVQEENR